MDYKNFNSKHFVLKELSEDVYAAIATDGGYAVSNAGLMDLGGLILVFDTFLTPRAAKDLSILSAEKFVHRPQLIVNSHYHNDHIWGNQALLPKAQILSSSCTRNLILTEGKREYDWCAIHSEEKFQFYQEQLQSTINADEQEKLKMWVGYYRGLVEAFPALEVKVPAITFDDHLEIHGEKQTARVIEFTGGHTGSDTILYLPQSGTVFMSDLLFVGCHPYLADGDPQKWLSILQEISLLDAKTFVPGHGPVGSMEDIKHTIAYIDHCFDCAQKLVDAGVPSEADLSGVEIPAAFQDWKLPEFYLANIKFLIEK
jgi:glyoxylase-like metal-dependent hydrolase (beta-lactamase superfamily II)